MDEGSALPEKNIEPSSIQRPQPVVPKGETVFMGFHKSLKRQEAEAAAKCKGSKPDTCDILEIIPNESQ